MGKKKFGEQSLAQRVYRLLVNGKRVKPFSSTSVGITYISSSCFFFFLATVSFLGFSDGKISLVIRKFEGAISDPSTRVLCMNVTRPWCLLETSRISYSWSNTQCSVVGCIKRCITRTSFRPLFAIRNRSSYVNATEVQLIFFSRWSIACSLVFEQLSSFLDILPIFIAKCMLAQKRNIERLRFIFFPCFLVNFRKAIWYYDA